MRPERPYDGARGLAIAEDRLFCQDPGQDPRGPRQMPITKKVKRRNYDAYGHKMPSMTTFGEGVGPAAHEERAVHTTCGVVSKKRMYLYISCRVQQRT